MYLFNKYIHWLSKAKFVALSFFVILLISCGINKHTKYTKQTDEEDTRSKISRLHTPLTICSGKAKELRDPPTISRESLLETRLIAKSINKCINGQVIPLQSYEDVKAKTDSRPVGPAYILKVDPEWPAPVLKISLVNELNTEN